jgi:predicted DNA-binding protein (UPF0251 family)
MIAEYVSSTTAAQKLGVSRRTVSRAAKSCGLGIFVEGRLVAISPKDIDRIRPAIHSTPGNPNWIANKKK